MQDLGHVFLDHNGKTWYASFFMKGLKIALYTRMELIYAVTKSQRKKLNFVCSPKTQYVMS